MKKIFIGLVIALFINGLLHATDTWSEPRQILSCKENRNIWNYRIKVYQYDKVSEDGTVVDVSYKAVLSEYNVFTDRDRVLRPSISVADKSDPRGAPGSPFVLVGEGFHLRVFATIVEGIEGAYSEFSGLSHRANPLSLKMGCQ